MGIGDTPHFEIEAVERGPLTKREIEILKLIAQGLDQKRIAEELYRSRRTIEHHTENIRQKLGARTLPQAVSIAWINGWLKARKTLCCLLVCGLLVQIDQPGVSRALRISRAAMRMAPLQTRRALDAS